MTPTTQKTPGGNQGLISDNPEKETNLSIVAETPTRLFVKNIDAAKVAAAATRAGGVLQWQEDLNKSDGTDYGYWTVNLDIADAGEIQICSNESGHWEIYVDVCTSVRSLTIAETRLVSAKLLAAVELFDHLEKAVKVADEHDQLA